jgi:hypothetical protein
MSTSDNSSLQGTPGGTATMGMLARAIIQRGQITTNVAMPGIVTAWRPPVSAGSESKPAMVDVRPDFKYARAIDVDDSAGPTEEVRDDPTRGKLAIGTLPVIPNVPVCYLGSGGMQVRGPIEVGECGLIVFCDRDIDDWIQDGGPAEPIMRHARHALINAIFIPGLRYGTVAHPVDPLLYRTRGPDRGPELARGDERFATSNRRHDHSEQAGGRRSYGRDGRCGSDHDHTGGGSKRQRGRSWCCLFSQGPIVGTGSYRGCERCHWNARR